MKYKLELIFNSGDNKWYYEIKPGEIWIESKIDHDGLLGPYYDAREAIGSVDKDFRKWKEGWYR